MLKVGRIEEVEITGYSSEGAGVCRIDGCAVFVPNAVRGERCSVKVTHVSKNSAHGKIERILERSPHRISRACPAAKLCGGCQLHHMDYAEELRFKAQKVTDALNRLGGWSLEVVPITGADGLRISRAEQSEGADRPAVPPEAYGYRNKAQYPVGEKNGRAVAGFYQNRTHEIVCAERCAILPECFDRVRDIVIRWAEEDRISVYDERTGKGLLRHIYVRRGAVTGELMVCIVANGDRLPREQRLVHALRRELSGLSSVILSVNTKNTNVVLGERFRTLWGKDEIEDELCGFRFRLSPRSFYQVNHDQAERLYAKAVELAELRGSETVLDLYCGTGTITLALSRSAGRVIGVEIVPQAVEDAKENALRNGVENVEFFCADATVAAERLCAEGAAPDVIVVDPPRKGLAPEVIDAVVKMSPARVVYVSCDPATLARDVKLLAEKGYTLTHAEAFDLFPRSFHVETVVLMTRTSNGNG